jgi:hypothetical protein
MSRENSEKIEIKIIKTPNYNSGIDLELVREAISGEGKTSYQIYPSENRLRLIPNEN